MGRRWLRVAAVVLAGPWACSGDAKASCGAPTSSSVTVEWISFGSWLMPRDATPVFVAFADGIADRGGGGTDRRKAALMPADLRSGELPPTFAISKRAMSKAREATDDGHRLLAWGWPGFPAPNFVGNVAVVPEDGSVQFLGNCIARFDRAFAAFATSGGSTERAVDVLVRILTDPAGETAQRFRATAGLTKAGP